MNKKNLLYIIIYLFVIALIIIYPMLSQNDIITTIKAGSDMPAHINYIQNFSNGIYEKPLYVGQVFVAFLLQPFAHSASFPTIYLWFNFIVLLGVVATFFYIAYKVFSLWSALLIIPIALFSTSGVISLFRYGVIFNVINMYIILPFAIYNLASWIKDKKLFNAVMTIVLFGLFSIFHVTSLYLVGGIGLFVALMVIYMLYKKERRNAFLTIFVGMIAVILSVYIPREFVASSSLTAISQSTDNSSILYRIIMMIRHQSIIVVALLVISVILLFKDKIYKSLNKLQSYALILFACFALAITGAVVIGLSSDILFINRLMVDASSMIAILTACLLGFVLNKYKNKTLNIVMSIIAIGGSIPLLIMWVK